MSVLKFWKNKMKKKRLHIQLLQSFFLSVLGFIPHSSFLISKWKRKKKKSQERGNVKSLKKIYHLHRILLKCLSQNQRMMWSWFFFFFLLIYQYIKTQIDTQVHIGFLFKLRKMNEIWRGDTSLDRLSDPYTTLQAPKLRPSKAFDKGSEKSSDLQNPPQLAFK